jgi:hypothetical protein
MFEYVIWGKPPVGQGEQMDTLLVATEYGKPIDCEARVKANMSRIETLGCHSLRLQTIDMGATGEQMAAMWR